MQQHLSKFKKTQIGEIPKEWEVTRLINLCKGKPQYGAAVSAIPKHDGIPRYVRITDIDDNGKLKNNKIVGIEEKEAKPFYLLEGDILFARTGSIGRTYIYSKRDGKCAFAGYLIRFIPEQDKLNLNFLFHFTHSDSYWKWIDSIHTIGVLQNINAEQYSQMPIPLPPLKEQQKIASILSNVDELIQKTEQIIEQTQRLKNGLMQRLLTKGIAHNKFKKTEVGEIPEGWTISAIGNEFTVGSGGTPSRTNPNYFKGDIPWVKTTELDYNYILDTEEKITKEALKNSSAKFYPKDTFVIAMIGLEAGKTMGRCAILGIDATVNQACAAMQTHGRVTIPFIFYYYQTLKRKILSLMAGTKRMNLNLELVKSIKIPVPSIEEQNKITNILKLMDSYLEKSNLTLYKIKNLKRGLMQQLLTGKIRVKV